MPIDVYVPTSLLTPPRSGGDANLFEMRTEAVSLGIQTERVGDTQLYKGITDLERFTLAGLLQLVGFGCEVYGYPVWIELNAIGYRGEVPVGIHNRTYVNDLGQTVTRKWSEWLDNPHEQHGLNHYVPHNVWGKSNWPEYGGKYGKELKGSEIKVLSDGGYTLKTVAEMEVIRGSS